MPLIKLVPQLVLLINDKRLQNCSSITTLIQELENPHNAYIPSSFLYLSLSNIQEAIYTQCLPLHLNLNQNFGSGGCATVTTTQLETPFQTKVSLHAICSQQKSLCSFHVMSRLLHSMCIFPINATSQDAFFQSFISSYSYKVNLLMGAPQGASY